MNVNSFEPLRYLIFKVQSLASLEASLFIIHRLKHFVNTFFELFSSFFKVRRFRDNVVYDTTKLALCQHLFSKNFKKLRWHFTTVKLFL